MVEGDSLSIGMREDKTIATGSYTNRRRFLELVPISSIALLSGCTGQDRETESPERADTVDDGSEAEADGSDVELVTLRLALASTPQTFNPYMSEDRVASAAHTWMYSGLIRLTPDLDLEGDLAKSWSATDGGKVWTFDLRDDAKFHHNGKSVTAEDVGASFLRASQDDTVAQGRGAGILGDVRIIDEYTIEMTLDSPYADWALNIARPWARVVPKDIAENRFDELTNRDFGSGPFILEEFEFGSGGRFVKYDDYYETNDSGEPLPKSDVLDVSIRPENGPRVNSLINNEVDLINGVPRPSFDRLNNHRQVNALSVPSGGIYPLIMNCSVEPFDDQNVRHAIKYAINNEELVTGALDGLGSLGQHHPISPAHIYHAKLPWKFGPGAKVDEARAKLEESGYSDGIEIEHPMFVPADKAPPLKPTSELIARQCEEAGIILNIRNITWDTFLAEVEGKENFMLASYTHRPFEDAFLRILLSKQSPFYSPHWDKAHPAQYERFAELINEAVATTDTDTRAQLYREVQEIVRDYGGVVIPYHYNQLGATRKSVKGYALHPSAKEIQLHATYK